MRTLFTIQVIEVHYCNIEIRIAWESVRIYVDLEYECMKMSFILKISDDIQNKLIKDIILQIIQ